MKLGVYGISITFLFKYILNIVTKCNFNTQLARGVKSEPCGNPARPLNQMHKAEMSECRDEE